MSRRCGGCDGSGIEYVTDPDTGIQDPQACHVCNGEGYVDDLQLPPGCSAPERGAA